MIGVVRLPIPNETNGAKPAVGMTKMAMHKLYTPCTPPVHRKV